MTANAILQATAAKLNALWPDRKVRDEEVPKDADGSFFIGVQHPAQKRELDKRYRRTATVQVVYFTKEHENEGYNDWAETMFQNFDDLVVEDQIFHARNLHAEKVGRDYHFLFDLDFGVMFPAPVGEVMQTLITKGGMKDG